MTHFNYTLARESIRNFWLAGNFRNGRTATPYGTELHSEKWAVLLCVRCEEQLAFWPSTKVSPLE